jgi:hypothetical protein
MLFPEKFWAFCGAIQINTFSLVKYRAFFGTSKSYGLPDIF